MGLFGRNTFTILRMRGGSGSYLLLPVLTTTQRNALTAVAGQLIANSTTGQVESYDGSNWVAVGKVYGDATFLPLAGGALTGDVTMAALKTIDTMDPSVHAADFDAHHFTPPPNDELSVGDYIRPLGGRGGAASYAADNYNYMSLYLPITMTFDRLGIYVVTAASSGKKAILGCYKHTNGAIGALQFDAGEIAISATGLIVASITQQLTAGWWWLVSNQQEAASLEGLITVVMPSMKNSPTSMMQSYRDAVTYPSPATLPTTPAVQATDCSISSPPVFFLRVKSVP